MPVYLRHLFVARGQVAEEVYRRVAERRGLHATVDFLSKFMDGDTTKFLGFVRSRDRALGYVNHLL